jgi:hypothetical protein
MAAPATATVTQSTNDGDLLTSIIAGPAATSFITVKRSKVVDPAFAEALARIVADAGSASNGKEYASMKDARTVARTWTAALNGSAPDGQRAINKVVEQTGKADDATHGGTAGTWRFWVLYGPLATPRPRKPKAETDVTAPIPAEAPVTA